MSFEQRVADAFEELRSEFRSKDKLAFLDDLEGRILDNDTLRDAIGSRVLSSRPWVMVTFDRRPNDTRFSYALADLALLAFHRSCGGHGTHTDKPMHQVRALRWNATPTALLAALKVLSRVNPQLRFRRILVVPYPLPPVGWRLYT